MDKNQQTSMSRKTLNREEFVNRLDTNRMSDDNGYKLGIQLILRAILLKINSEKANDSLQASVLEQVDTISKMLCDSELKFVSEYYPEVPDISLDVIKTEVAKNMEQMRLKAREVVVGIFSPPANETDSE